MSGADDIAVAAEEPEQAAFDAFDSLTSRGDAIGQDGLAQALLQLHEVLLTTSMVRAPPASMNTGQFPHS